ncbi:MAG TPA: HPr(Ser) kinase/phosphatase [Candidatus Kapabacteria bacterium]|nr:HPr(Ser) kinase/phosphatase [Candidatus Kapabacteria bacterium]
MSSILQNLEIIRKDHLTVGFFYKEAHERFDLRMVNGEVGFNKKITEPNLHRPQLALAGYTALFTYHRIQIFGNTEIYYLRSLSLDMRKEAFRRILEFDIPCIIITNGNTLDDELVAIATERNIPLFFTAHETTKTVYLIGDFLDDQFALQSSLHASFVDVYGVGVLFIGRSGIGKSEVALDLVERGHRLVADDVVLITKKGEGILIGSGTSLVQHFMEIRGLGIIDVRQMFGVRAIRFQKRVEVIVELEERSKDLEFTRTGLDPVNVQILGVPTPKVQLPIFAGKNITVIAEVIALNYLLDHYGYNAAKILSEKLQNTLKEKSKRPEDRAIHYFEHDFE